MPATLDVNKLKAHFDSKNRSTLAASVKTFERVGSSSAKVAVTFNARVNEPARYFSAICAAFGNRARPVENSFREIHGQDYPTFIGYVKTNVHTRSIEQSSTMRVMAANLYMDPEDESLWEVKASGGSKHLVKSGTEDITALMEVAGVKTGSTTQVDLIGQNFAAENRKFCTYLDPDTRAVRHGYILSAENVAGEPFVELYPYEAESRPSDRAFPDRSYTPDFPPDSSTELDGSGDEEKRLEQVKRNSVRKRTSIRELLKPVRVNASCIIEVASMNGDDCFEELAAPDGGSKQAMIDYYRKVYYEISPEYFNNLVSIINQHSAF